jgi:antitoxin CptB
MESCFRELEPQLREDYQQLMSHEDQDILNWIMGREALSDESLIAITDRIRAHNRSKLR